MSNRKVITSIIFYAFLVTSLFGCLSKKEETNPDFFYENIRGWDWIRIPLIKPYDLRKANPQDSDSMWDIAFVNPLGTYNVKKVDVKDSIIFILSGNIGGGDSTIVDFMKVSTGWFIIDTKSKKERGFFTEKDFYEYIANNRYPRPLWLDVDSLSISIINENKLPWRQ